jgi:hypothetical protein
MNEDGEDGVFSAFFGSFFFPRVIHFFYQMGFGWAVNKTS